MFIVYFWTFKIIDFFFPESEKEKWTRVSQNSDSGGGVSNVAVRKSVK